jgi:hypothetical protein
VERFVREGGSLLVLSDHTNVYGLRDNLNASAALRGLPDLARPARARRLSDAELEQQPLRAPRRRRGPGRAVPRRGALPADRAPSWPRTRRAARAANASSSCSTTRSTGSSAPQAPSTSRRPRSCPRAPTSRSTSTRSARPSPPPACASAGPSVRPT